MSTPTTERDLWALCGMTIAATSAAVASFSGLRSLASVAGWPEHLAWLLPVTVDAYAMTSTRLWLAGRARHRHARRFAAANSLGAIAGSIAGNAIYHAVSTGLLSVTWPIVVSVGAVPAAVLGLIAHLHALHSGAEPVPESESLSGSEPGQETEPNPVPQSGDGDGLRPGGGDGPEARPEDRPGSGTEDRPGYGTQDRTVPGRKPRIRRTSQQRRRYRTEAELLEAARTADQRHRDRHSRPITRDALRAALKISGSRATELRRILAADGLEVPAPDAKEVVNH